MFGDAGWPPRHNVSCGLSPSQKANLSYLALTRLLSLPKSGTVDEAYVQALVAQVREARKVIPGFRVVLLAQDCRYTPQGDPDWLNSTVYVPNEHLFRVVERYPDWFIPCPSINPQRKDWEAELAKCVARGARVVKVHPPTQAVDPSEPHFREFYREVRTEWRPDHGPHGHGTFGADREPAVGRCTTAQPGVKRRLHGGGGALGHPGVL